jgi:RPA family protein
MEGAARVFAGEFNRSTLSLPGPAGTGSVCVVTRSGAWCGTIFVAGALVEAEGTTSDVMRARVADPTGAFEIPVGRQQAEAARSLREIDPPAFVTVIGSARMYTSRDKVSVSIIPDEIRVTDRTVRDTWVLRTADLTLRRIDAVRRALEGTCVRPELKTVLNHYRTTEQDLQALAGFVETALASIQPAQAPPPASDSGETRAAIMEIMKNESGPRGISIEDLFARANRKGISSEEALRIIRTLVEEDECYQPQKGMVKLL